MNHYKYSFQSIFVIALCLAVFCLSNSGIRADSIRSTFLGSTAWDRATIGAMAINDAGNIYIVCRTNSSNFPKTDLAYDASYNGNGDIAISLLSADLSTLLASTFLGGSGSEYAMRNVSITLDDTGNVIVAGQTFSIDFPTTTGAYRTTRVGNQDIFIAKLSPDLATLKAATYLGSPGDEEADGIAVDPDGYIFVTGYTRNAAFPVTPPLAFDTTYNGTRTAQWGGDIFVSKFSSDLTTLVASTFLGGSDWDDGGYLDIDADGNIYVAGTTKSSNFPVSGDALYGTMQGGSYGGDGFVSKLNNNLSTLLASTYLGGEANDWIYGVFVGDDGNVYTTGHTASTTYPISPEAFIKIYMGTGGVDVGDDAFVTILNGSLNALVSSTYMGGTGWDNASSVFTDGAGQIYLGGNSSSADFRIRFGSYDSTMNGGGFQYGGDGTVSMLNSNLSELISSTYLGGSGQETVQSMALNVNGDLYVTGTTNSTDFPATPGVYDDSYNGGTGSEWDGDVFIVMLPAGHFTDDDIDGVVDFGDNCPEVYNPGQEDHDGDGVGSACIVCGDANGDGNVNLIDILYLIDFKYSIPPGPEPVHYDAADVNKDGNINLLDILYLIDFKYSTPPGPDPTCF